MDAPRKTCPVLVGPTAVGKTGLVMALAESLPLEVISLDSRQIYRGLRIGTAQPTAQELAACSHHLVDFVDPDESYDAQRFRRDFCRVHEEITARGGMPLLVGGAGMYLTAVQKGFMDVPGQTPDSLVAVREELAPLPDEEVRRRLAAVDPASCRRLHHNDRQRSQRALEVHMLSGRSMTELQAEQKPDPALGLGFPVIVLERPTPELDQRIAARTEIMLEGGWLEETEAALARHSADGPGLGSIGYREVVKHLRGEMSRQELAPAIVRVTRQYGKRQRTWFRNLEAVCRARPGDPALKRTVLEILSAPGP